MIQASEEVLRDAPADQPSTRDDSPKVIQPAIRSRSIYLPATRGKSKSISLALAISLFVHAILLFGLLQWAPAFLPFTAGKVAGSASSMGGGSRGGTGAPTQQIALPAGAISVGKLHQKYPSAGLSTVFIEDSLEADFDFAKTPWPAAWSGISFDNRSLTRSLAATFFQEPSPISFGPRRAELFAAPAIRKPVASR